MTTTEIPTPTPDEDPSFEIDIPLPESGVKKIIHSKPFRRIFAAITAISLVAATVATLDVRNENASARERQAGEEKLFNSMQNGERTPELENAMVVLKPGATLYEQPELSKQYKVLGIYPLGDTPTKIQSGRMASFDPVYYQDQSGDKWFGFRPSTSKTGSISDKYAWFNSSSAPNGTYEIWLKNQAAAGDTLPGSLSDNGTMTVRGSKESEAYAASYTQEQWDLIEKIAGYQKPAETPPSTANAG